MSSEINLLQQKPQNVSSTLTRRIRILRTVALAFLFVVPTGTVILFLFIFFSPLPTLQAQEKYLLLNSAAVQNKANKVSFILDRLQGSSQFIAKRTTYDKPLAELTSVLPNGVLLDITDIASNIVTLSASSNSLASLQMYQINLQAVPSQSQLFTKISLKSINLDEGSSVYTMTLQLITHE